MKMPSERSEAIVNLHTYNVDNKKACHKFSASTLAQLTHNDVKKLDTVNIACELWQRNPRFANKLDVDHHWFKSRTPAAQRYARSRVSRIFRDARTRGISKNLRKHGKDANLSHIPRSFSPEKFAAAAKAQEKLTHIISCDTSGVVNHQNEDLDIQYSETLVPIMIGKNPHPSNAQMDLAGVELDQHGDYASHDWPAVTDSFQTWRIPGGCINIHTAGIHPCHDIYYHNTRDDQQPAFLVTMME